MKCSQCNRQFATQAALTQHQRAAHGGGSSQGAKKRTKQHPTRASAPVQLGAMQKPANRLSVVERGSDVLAVTTVNAVSLHPGSLLTRAVISPRKFEGTRLWQQSNMWSRWSPVSLTFRVSSTCPSTGGGLYALAWSADDREMLPVDPTALARKLGVMPYFCQANFWEHCTIRVAEPPIQKWLYTNVGQDDIHHGCFILVCIAPPLAITGSISFTVELDWVIRFDSPDIDLQSVSPTEYYIRPDAGYDPFFTTGSTHLDTSTKLTLESSSAGGYSSIVRWSQADTSTVYVPQLSSVLAYYKDKDGKEKLTGVKAFVRMKERAEPFLWCFLTEDKAKAYVATGDVANIMDYVAAGPWTTPGTILRAIKTSSDHSNDIPGVRLKTTDEDVLRAISTRGAAPLSETLNRLQDTMDEVLKRLSSMSLGTLLDPVKTVVLDPVPLPMSLAPPSPPGISSEPIAWTRTRSVSVGTDMSDVVVVDGDELPDTLPD
nr:MAG: putative coat protein [Eriocheir sinensis tombusvirus 3]